MDECDTNSHEKASLKALETLRIKSSSSIFVTSRSYPDDIKKTFGSAPQIIIGADDDNLQIYISREIDGSDNFDVIEREFRKEIIVIVSQAAQKMFLLAVLQIQAILAEPTFGEMEETLSTIPWGLNGAFEETLQRIHKLPDGRRRLGLSTLMWVSHMTVDCCLGLVTVDEEGSVIGQVHSTVQEHFCKHLDPTFALGEQTIAELSITHLLTESFAQGCCPDEISIIAVISHHPFIKYADQL
ncbi:hypothetical protein HO133_010377 [Letharia lupina]|uniref:Uncharacterized protein n=1 Tax=Letharia lupina TaxID=560253 RepID=A0A8H6CK93_9LECA|nr:uncharacterized protein HO133_010377 [Letharia lupina]KAF6225180.1 hypothetical protein HO133_010377 [Letharia lupina]